MPAPSTKSLGVKVPAEFSAVLLIGFGSRMSCLTEDEQVPKGMLPIANKPMLFYQLQWLEKIKCIQNVFIVCHQTAKGKLNDYLRTYEGSRETSIELVATDNDGGSADALRTIKDKIKSDFLVLSSDLILDISPHLVIDCFRALNSSMTALFYETSGKEGSETRGTKDEDLSDVVGIDFTKSRLVSLKSRVDIDETLSMRVALLKKYPVVNICTKLRDAHLYVFRKWVIDLLAQKESMSSLRNDLIPMLLRCQYDEEYSKREHLVQFMATQPNLMADAYLLSLTGRPSSLHSSPLFQERLSSVSGSAASSNHGLVSSPSTDKTNLATTTGSSSLHALQAPSSSSSSGGNNADGCFESLVCSAMIVKEKDGFCARANTVGTFLDVNLKMAKQVTSIDPRNMSNVEIGQKSQIGMDCLIGGGTKVSEKCSVKRSVIGAHCTIGKNCKIKDSVIMDYVVIEDGVKLEGCVVCSSAKILEKASLKDCEVANGFEVEKDTTAKNEAFIDYSE